jgi:hypothetical protein
MDGDLRSSADALSRYMLTGGVLDASIHCNRLLSVGFLAERSRLGTPPRRQSRVKCVRAGPDATLGPVLVANDAALVKQKWLWQKPDDLAEHFRESKSGSIG